MLWSVDFAWQDNTGFFAASRTANLTALPAFDWTMTRANVPSPLTAAALRYLYPDGVFGVDPGGAGFRARALADHAGGFAPRAPIGLQCHANVTLGFRAAGESFHKLSLLRSLHKADLSEVGWQHICRGSCVFVVGREADPQQAVG